MSQRSPLESLFFCLKLSGISLIFSDTFLFSDFGLFSDQVETLSNQALSHASGLGFLWQIGKYRAIRFDLTLYPKVKFSVGTAWKL